MTDLQQLVDALFGEELRVSQLDLILAAENYDFGADVMEVIELLPPGSYTRASLCDQLNSIVTAHGWSSTVGCVE